MGLNNAERQQRFREQRNALAKSVTLKGWVHLKTQPQEYARLAVALMLALTRHGTGSAHGATDVLHLRLGADTDGLPPDVPVGARLARRRSL